MWFIKPKPELLNINCKMRDLTVDLKENINYKTQYVPINWLNSYKEITKHNT